VGSINLGESERLLLLNEIRYCLDNLFELAFEEDYEQVFERSDQSSKELIESFFMSFQSIINQIKESSVNSVSDNLKEQVSQLQKKYNKIVENSDPEVLSDISLIFCLLAHWFNSYIFFCDNDDIRFEITESMVDELADFIRQTQKASAGVLLLCSIQDGEIQFPIQNDQRQVKQFKDTLGLVQQGPILAPAIAFDENPGVRLN